MYNKSNRSITTLQMCELLLLMAQVISLKQSWDRDVTLII